MSLKTQCCSSTMHCSKSKCINYIIDTSLIFICVMDCRYTTIHCLSVDVFMHIYMLTNFDNSVNFIPCIKDWD